ncbi:MAG: hypothetical protein Q7T56_18200 [Nocardioidaceae bacterium]|nr:hypothetical protein [Nocardioidaceae bacterium]
MSTTSTDAQVDQGADLGGSEDTVLPIADPQELDGPIFKQVWQSQVDALEASIESGDGGGGSHRS